MFDRFTQATANFRIFLFSVLAFGVIHPTTAQQSGDSQIKQLMAFRQSQPLTANRTWTLQNGWQVSGSLSESMIEGIFRVKQSGRDVQSASYLVPLKMFQPEDQKTILAKHNRGYSYVRYQYLPPLARGIEQWKDAPPAGAAGFRQPVAIENGKVFAFDGKRLYVVDASAVADEELRELTERYRAFGNGEHLVVDNWVPHPVHGQVLHETEEAFVLQAGPSLSQGESVAANIDKFALPKGQAYRLPKYSMGFVLGKEFRGILNRAKRLGITKEFSDEELRQLPIAMRGRSGWTFGFDLSAPNQSMIRFYAGPLETREMEAASVSCEDLFHLELSVLRRSGEMSADRYRDQALLRVAETAFDRDFWNLQPGFSKLQGTLLGAFENGFAFQFINGEHLFVEASQLAEIDRQAAQIATRDDDLQWLTGEVLAGLMKYRVVVKDLSVVVVEVQGMTNEAPGIDGQTVKMSHTYGDALDWWYLYLDHLSAVTNSMKHQAELQAMVRDRGVAELRDKLASRIPSPTSELPDLASKVAVADSKRWYIGEQGQTIVGKLVGKWGEDLLFVEDNDPTATPVLLARKHMASKHDAELRRLEDRLPDRDWETELPMTRDGQFFRFWVKPETGKIAYNSAGAIIDFEHDKPLPGQLTVTLQKRDGDSFTAVFSSENKPNPASLLTEFRRHWAEGQQRVAKLQEGFPRWEFRGHTDSLHAEPVAIRGDDVVMKDFQGETFLVRIATLDDRSRQQLAALKLPTMDPDAAPEASATIELEPEKWLRMLSVSSGLIGPAVVKETGYESDDTLKLRMLNGALQTMPVKTLTLREGRALHAVYLRQRDNLSDDRSIDAVLSQPVASDDVVHQTPPVKAETRERIENAIDANRHTIVWDTTPLKIDSEASLLAIDHSAQHGVMRDSQGKLFRVGLTGGQTLPSDDLPSRVQYGPWLHNDGQQVWWIAEGKLMVGDGKQAKVLSIDGTSEPILAADQSGDFDSLVIEMKDSQQFRWDLKSSEAIRLTKPSNRRRSEQNVHLFASSDGWTVARLSEQAIITRTARPEPDAHGNFLGMLGLESALAAAGEGYTLVSEADAARAQLIWNRFGLRPRTVGLPFLPQRMDMVRLEERDVVQLIGRPLDPHFDKAGYTFVDWYDPGAGYGRFKYQIIEGTIGEDSIVGAGGKLIVHRRGQDYVVSRRPDPLVKPIERVIGQIAGELVEQLDIAQIEAVSDFLASSEMRSEGSYQGALADEFYSAIQRSFFSFMPHLGGDSIDRSLNVAQHLLTRYPESQVARCALADLHHSIAWNARGGGYASTVTEKGWQIFHEHIREGIEVIKPLATVKAPIAQVYHLRLGFATSAGMSLDQLRKLAIDLQESEHRENASLHQQIAVYLLPRWHGKPGMVEHYLSNVADTIGGDKGDAVYAKAIELMKGMASQQGPVTFDHRWDIDRLVRGTQAYYTQRHDPALIDHMMALLAHHNQWSEMMELLELTVKRSLLAPGIAIVDTSTLGEEQLRPTDKAEAIGQPSEN